MILFHNFRPGVFLVDTRNFFKGGFSSILGREITRRKILVSEPVRYFKKSTFEIHMLTGRYDWLNSIWALKSFMHFSDECPQIVIHDDGSLKDLRISKIKKIFPGSIIISRSQSDQDIESTLTKYPNCLRFRKSNYLAQKVVDFAFYLNSPKMLLLDSDVLFFHRPGALLNGIKDQTIINMMNRNPKFGYAIPNSELFRRFTLPMTDHINSGLGVMSKESFDLDFIEKILHDNDIANGHPHRIEQTLIALCCVRAGHSFLPADYDVYYGKTSFHKPCRHYFSPERARLYSEGMSFLAGHIL